MGLLLLFASSSTLPYYNKALTYAQKYDIDAMAYLETIQCESGFDPTIQSYYKDPTGPNGREDSWGLAQIHLPDHKDITRAQATDPDFALEYMAKQFSLGKNSQWTCYRKLAML